jgi:arabinose-5-phosphate isomerase
MPKTQIQDSSQVILQIARDSFIDQSRALTQIADRLGDKFVVAVNLIKATEGRVIVVGMGKSGHIGRKIAATLASTGTPSFFVHPSEAYHGDLGMITKNDVVILISYSGETEEVVRILPWLQRQGIPSIAMTGSATSTLGKNADVLLDVMVDKEVCPHNLAPTTSTTTTLVMGDALAVTLMNLRDFRPQDFAFFHPGGSLGRRLLTRVEDVMHKDFPINHPDDSVRAVISTITRGRLGLTLVMDGSRICGIITDGDLRRSMNIHDDFRELKAKEIMFPTPVSVRVGTMFNDAEHLMREKKINSLLVLSADGYPVGVLQIYDLE